MNILNILYIITLITISVIILLELLSIIWVFVELLNRYNMNRTQHRGLDLKRRTQNIAIRFRLADETDRTLEVKNISTDQLKSIIDILSEQHKNDTSTKNP